MAFKKISRALELVEKRQMARKCTVERGAKRLLNSKDRRKLKTVEVFQLKTLPLPPAMQKNSPLTKQIRISADAKLCSGLCRHRKPTAGTQVATSTSLPLCHFYHM